MGWKRTRRMAGCRPPAASRRASPAGSTKPTSNHRAQIKKLGGTSLEAEAEARRASDELEGFVPVTAAFAFYQIGEIRPRRGDLPAAEEALLRAQAMGQDPDLPLSLLRLAQGKVSE